MKVIGINYGECSTDEAVVSVRDHGFLYGMGLFETFRTYKGTPFLLDRHIRRMEEGCRQLGITAAIDAEALNGWIRRVMAANGLEEAYIRYTISAGEDIIGLPSGPYTKPNHVLFAKALPRLPETLYTAGKELQLLKLARNTPEGPVRLKSLHYMNNILAKRELSGYPSAARGAEGLLLTADGYAAEGIVSNLFFVKDGRLFTPSAETGILPGITREMVLELAARDGIRCEEGKYRRETLLTADEMFITNSIQELVPVTGLWEEERRCQVGAGTVGPVTGRLLTLYRKEAGL